MHKVKTIFLYNDQALKEMVTLHRQGWSSVRLGIRYHCDHTTILFWLKKYAQGKKYQLTCLTCKELFNGYGRYCSEDCYPYKPMAPSSRYDYQDINGEKLNPGKDYKEYLREEFERKATKAERITQTKPPSPIKHVWTFED